MEIYIARNGERIGPYTLEEINRQLAAGTLSPLDEAWSEASPGWKPILTFPGVIMPGGASSTALPVATATMPHHPAIDYAGFWIRSLAFMIDCIVLCIPAAIIQITFGPSPSDPAAGYPVFVFIAVILLELIYFAWLWSSRWQATVGQKLCELRVIDSITRERISFRRGLGRCLMLWLGIAICLVGVLMIAFSERKRGLHDIIAGTYVVRLE